MLGRITAALIALALFSGLATAQSTQKSPQRDGARATDFSAHLFFEASGELSPNIFTLEEFGAWSFSAQWKGNNGGKFSGFLIRVKLESRTGKEVFSQGRLAQFVLRDRKTKKMLQTWNISDVYVGDNGVSYRAQFFANLDCQLMEATLTSGGRTITRDLPFACGE
jgi:hypothetical protein